MNLCDDKDLFEQSILQTSKMLNMNPAIVEKDYYVAKMLRYLVDMEPNIIFKGGTSLSKFYELIQRFLEDIDLNYGNRGEKITEGMKKKLIATGLWAIAAEYDLSPFDVTVQTKERTFVDKIFAICDYYLLDNITEHSSHLYDVYKLFPTITADNTSGHYYVQSAK